MEQEYEYLWTTEKNDYVLVLFRSGDYSIFNLKYRTALIIEDDKEYEFVKNQMRQNNRVVKIELIDYLLYNRPVPRFIGNQNGKEVYIYPDTGEKFELDIAYPIEEEPLFSIAVRWSNDIPLIKQIVYLRKICPGIEMSTPDLLDTARKSKEYIFITYCTYSQAARILNEGIGKGLDVYKIPI